MVTKLKKNGVFFHVCFAVDKESITSERLKIDFFFYTTSLKGESVN